MGSRSSPLGLHGEGMPEDRSSRTGCTWTRGPSLPLAFSERVSDLEWLWEGLCTELRLRREWLWRSSLSRRLLLVRRGRSGVRTGLRSALDCRRCREPEVWRARCESRRGSRYGLFDDIAGFLQSASASTFTTPAFHTLRDRWWQPTSSARMNTPAGLPVLSLPNAEVDVVIYNTGTQLVLLKDRLARVAAWGSLRDPAVYLSDNEQRGCCYAAVVESVVVNECLSAAERAMLTGTCSSVSRDR